MEPDRRLASNCTIGWAYEHGTMQCCMVLTDFGRDQMGAFHTASHHFHVLSHCLRL